MPRIICPVCQSSVVKFQGKYTFKSIYFKGMTRQKCNDCNLQFASPMPSNKLIENYNRSYHDNAHGGKKRDKKLQGFFTGISRTRIEFIKKNFKKFNSNKKIKLLEIGPGPGAFASVWQDEFPLTEYHAIETDKSCYKILKKLDIKINESGDLNNFECYFDLIVVSHVLEHVSSPIFFLKPLIKSLNNKGIIFIEVPCNDWKHKKIVEPHLLFFDKMPMQTLIDQLNLKALKVAYYGKSIRKTKNIFFNLIDRVRNFIYYKINLKIYHPKRNQIKKILKNKYEVEALLNYDAHQEQIEESLWLRVLLKK